MMVRKILAGVAVMLGRHIIAKVAGKIVKRIFRR